jgi:hypothetical protein
LRWQRTEDFLINVNRIEAKVHKQVRYVLVLLGDYGRENTEDGLRQRGLVKLELLDDSAASVFIQAPGVLKGLVKLASAIYVFRPLQLRILRLGDGCYFLYAMLKFHYLNI